MRLRREQMLLTIRESPSKMDFNTFKARIVALAGEVERKGGRSSTLFCGPDSEYDKLTKTTTQFWRAKVDVTGPMTEAEIKVLQETVMKNESIQAKQGILSKKR